MVGGDIRVEKYACDACRSKKVACTREPPGCRRCRRTGARCTYSRSGIISRKRKGAIPRVQFQSCEFNSPHDATNRHGAPFAPAVGDGSSGFQSSHLAADIEATRKHLDTLNTPERQRFLETLASLSQACAREGITPETRRLGVATSCFSGFEEYSLTWTKVFEDFLRQRAPLMLTAPPDVVDYLRTARPHKVLEKAWLVMFYGIILGTETATSLQEELQQNLWRALSDVDVLLRPSEINLQAILLVLSQVSEIAAPSICWMLATTAARMLQALGLNLQLLDQQTRQRRLLQFWHLNLLDKGLSIIFMKPPTFPQEVVKQIELPTLEQIQPPRAHLIANDKSGFFAAHYVYQKFLLSRLMDDVWHCIYGKTAPNCSAIEAAIKDLASWYDKARKILDAAAQSEKPFCDAKNAKSIDVALRTIEFHFVHLKILLTRSIAYMQDQCLDASRQLLHLLEDMAPEFNEPYHPILWQLVCGPFTPLLILFCDILSNTSQRCTVGPKKADLAAMEKLPMFLQALRHRSSLAANLEGIAGLFVQHARSVITRLDPAATTPDTTTTTTTTTTTASNTSTAAGPLSVSGDYSEVPDSDLLVDWTSFHANAASVLPVPTQLDNDLDIFLKIMDGDGTFDWLNWDAQGCLRGEPSETVFH